MTPRHGVALNTARNLLTRGVVPGRALGVLVEYVCDAHVTRDPVGPFVTPHDGAWAYCAGHGESEHRWRHITAVPRELLDRTAAKVEYLCALPPHIERGKEVPDGQGNVYVIDGKWSYCSAARDEAHDWKPVTPLEFRDISHDGLADVIAAG